MSVFNVILFLISISSVYCKEYTPVLLWSTQASGDSYPLISALSRLSTNEFSDYLLKRVKVVKPLILLFVEENLSVEDFSWRDVDANGAYPMLNNLTKLADDVAFLPSVREPYRALKRLHKHGYTWRYYDEQDGFESLKPQEKAIYEVKLSEPDYLEDRPDMLKRHDEQMSKIYNEALNYKGDILVVYTGNHSSWIDSELGRFKREDTIALENNSSNTLVIKDSNNVVILAATIPIVFENRTVPTNPVVINITKVIGEPTIPNPKTVSNVTLRVRFDLGNKDEISVNFNFKSVELEWWTLENLLVSDQFLLKPNVDVGAPANYSYFCNPNVNFSNGNISMTFENFQAQPRVGVGNSFGPILHCIPFFSIAIWSGLVVVIILSVVLAWGIVMIMDINTNDRFDDPKGKTITITATD